MIKHLRIGRIIICCLSAFVSVPAFAQDWTWTKGSNIVNAQGVSAPLGVTLMSNMPGARTGAASWTDNSGNLWLFGGDGYAVTNTGRLDDLWRYTIATNQWTRIVGNNFSNQYGVYGTKGTAGAGIRPGARAYSVSWKDASGNFWLFGGEGYDKDGNFGNLNDLWKFDLGLLQWTWVAGSDIINQNGLYGTQGVASTTNTPGSRRLSSGWVDNSGVLWLFGGYGLPVSGGENSLSDLWKFNTGTLQWTWVKGANVVNQTAAFGTLGVGSTTNTPGARYGTTTWKDNSNNLWLCNGYGYATSGPGHLSDIWMYNISSNQWTWVDGSNTLYEARAGVEGATSATATPGARYYSASWTDATGNLYLQGGASNVGNHGDLWKYNINTLDWTWLRGNDGTGTYGTMGTTAPLNEPGAGYLRTFWKDNSNNMWLFGGTGYDSRGSFANLNELWKMSLPTVAPVANFSFNQTANVCLGSRIRINNLSTNNPAAYNFYLDGTLWSFDREPVLQNPPYVTALSAGTHTLSLVVSNAAGVSSAVTRTISVLPLTASTITRTPAGTYTMNIGSAQTPNSSWDPWVYTFTDPLPPGVSITSLAVTYNGADQGWGGSGQPATITFADEMIANGVLGHGVQSYSYNVVSMFQNYNYGGANTVKVYFMGWSGWQANISNLQIQVSYERSNIRVCPGNTVNLTAASGGVRLWSGGALEGVPFVPASSGIYTVTSTDVNTCISTHTVAVTIENPTITAYGGQICSGTSFSINPTGAFTYTYNPGGSGLVTPTTTTTYSITGKSMAGCAATNTAVVTVSVDVTPTISVTNGLVCSGTIFTINVAGTAVTYTNNTLHTSVGPASTVLAVGNKNYNISATSANGCISNMAVVSVNTNPVPDISIISQDVCAGQTNTLSLRKSYGLRFNYGAVAYTPIYYLNDFTIEYWMRTTQTNAALPGIDSWRNGNSVVDGMSYSDDLGTAIIGDKLAFGVGGPDATIYSTSSINTGNWTHVAVSWSFASGDMKLYINGNLEASGNTAAGNTRYFSQLTMGSNPYGTSYFDGTLDDVRIWQEVRTSGQIMADKSSCLTGAEANLLASYSIEEGPGNTNLLDQSPNMNTAYVYGINPATDWVMGAEVCSGGSALISYLWSPGAISTPTAAINILTPTVYTLTVVDNYTCTTNVTTTVTPIPAPVITAAGGTICAGNVFTINPAGAVSYTFSGGSNTVSPGSSTSYSVTGTSTAGCVSTSPTTVGVAVNALPAIAVSGNSSICYGSTVTQTATGASSYVWNTGPVTSTVTLSPSVTTTYTVIGTDALTSCSNVAVKVITVTPLPVIAVNSGSMCTGNVYTMTPSGALTYTFSNGSNTVSPAATTSYSVTGTDVLGCVSASAAVADVTVYTTPVISVPNGTICFGKVFTMVPAGASTYNYSSGSNTVSPASTTSYSVTGTSTAGCVSGPVNVGVTVNALPVVAVSGNTSVCYGSAVTQTATGASSYVWSSGPVTSTISLNPTVTTIYTVTGTDALTSCTNTATKAITVTPLPVIAVNSGTVCTGHVFTMSPSGALSYTFSNGSNTVSPLSNTSYSVTGTDALGCISAAPAVANVTAYITPLVAVAGGTVCYGKTFTIMPTGASTYTYSGGSSMVTPLADASYSVTGTSLEGCVSSNTAVADVTVVPLPLVAVSGNTSVCFGSAVTQTATGASSYVWSTGPSASTISLNPLNNTSYTVTGTDAATGCSNTAVKMIAVDPLPVIAVNSGTVCAGSVFSLVPSGAVTYTFSGGSGTVAPLTSTGYSVTGTDAKGCISAGPAVANVTAYPLPVITANSGAICTGNSFTIIPAGASTYTYLSGAQVVSPLVNTSYSISGTSSYGCRSSVPGISTVTVNALPVLTISGPNAVCSGSFVIQNVSGADTYSWNTGATTPSISVTPTVLTVYSVTGTNTATGCFNTIMKTVNVGTPPVVTVNSGNMCAGSSFTLLPAGAATYTITDGTQTVSAIVSPNSNTSYFVTGTSAQGCVSTGTAISNVIVSAAPVIVVNSGAICTGNVFTMTPTGASSYTYSSGSATVSPGSNTSYTVTGTNVLGCVSTVPAIAHVTVNPIPVISASNGSVCAGQSYSIVPAGAATYTYLTSSGPVSPWVSPAANTNYSITGTSLQGCRSSNTAVITVSVIALPLISVNSSTVCAGSVFTLMPTGAGTYTYSSGTATVIPAGNTSYSVTGTSAQGCVSANAAVATVTLIAAPLVSVNSGTICSGEVFTMTPTGASTYLYSNLSATAAPVSNTAYTVTGVSAAGCLSSNAAIANVFVNSSPTLAVLGNQVVCSGESTSLFATGASSYTWSPAISWPGSPAATTIYTVSGTGANFCVSSETVMITVNALPALTLNTGTVCPNGSFTIVPAGALTYTYSSGSDVVIPAVTTSYSVTGTDANGCVSLPAVTTVTVINAISISAGGNTLVCAGSPATLTASGAASYTWSTGELSGSIVTTPTANSTYTVIGANGTCMDTTYISVQLNALPDVQVYSTASVICVGESVNLTASGADTYQWGGGETTTVIVVSPGVTASYTLTGTAANGCVNKTVFTQTVSECLGMDNSLFSFTSLIKLYPNPNTGEFVIETPKQMHISIRNSLGQLILEKQLEEGKNSMILQEQAKGIYFVEFRNDKAAKTIKVIKQ